MGGWTKCNWNGPIPGELEYQRSCLAAGGTTKTFSGDFSCHVTDAAGVPFVFIVDQTIVAACVPSSIDMDACFESLLMDILDVAETNRESIFENAVCTMGDLEVMGPEAFSSMDGNGGLLK